MYKIQYKQITSDNTYPHEPKLFSIDEVRRFLESHFFVSLQSYHIPFYIDHLTLNGWVDCGAFYIKKDNLK